MIATMKQVQHDRARTEIKRHVFPDLCARMAVDLKLEETARLDC